MKSPHVVRPTSPSSAVVLSRASHRDRGLGSKEMELVQTIGVLWGEVKKRDAALKGATKEVTALRKENKRLRQIAAKQQNCHSRLMHEGESVVRCEVCKDKCSTGCGLAEARMDDQQRARLIEAEDTMASLKLTIGYLERENAKLHSELEKNHRLKMVSDESCGSAVRREAGVRREVIDELLERLDSACDKIKDTSYAENGGPSLVRHSDGDEARWDRILRGVGRRPNRPKAWRVSGFSSLPDTAGATWRTREGHMIKNQSFYGLPRSEISWNNPVRAGTQTWRFYHGPKLKADAKFTEALDRTRFNEHLWSVKKDFVHARREEQRSRFLAQTMLNRQLATTRSWIPQRRSRRELRNQETAWRDLDTMPVSAIKQSITEKTEQLDSEGLQRICTHLQSERDWEDRWKMWESVRREDIMHELKRRRAFNDRLADLSGQPPRITWDSGTSLKSASGRTEELSKPRPRFYVPRVTSETDLVDLVCKDSSVALWKLHEDRRRKELMERSVTVLPERRVYEHEVPEVMTSTTDCFPDREKISFEPSRELSTAATDERPRGNAVREEEERERLQTEEDSQRRLSLARLEEVIEDIRDFEHKVNGGAFRGSRADAEKGISRNPVDVGMNGTFDHTTTPRVLKATPELLPTAYSNWASDDMLAPILKKLIDLRSAGNRPELAPYFEMVDEMLVVGDEVAKLEEESSKLDRNDTSMKDMFRTEVDAQIEKLVEVEGRLFAHLHTRMSTEGIECATWHEYVKDASDCTVEIRPGVGGVEAGKWCKDIFDMLERFAGVMGWAAPEVKVMEQGWQSGYREIIADFSLKPGVKRTPEKGVFGFLKFEAGIHRAVRIRHIESGIEGFADCYRALKSNKALALQQVSRKIMEEKGKKIAKERGILRKQYMGTGDRSEKIRSYNYLNGTVVDHRLPKPDDGLSALEDIMNGEGLLQDMIEPLRLQEYRQRVKDYVVFEL
ncbi:Peptide chain release factor [Perkinsus olseni]|uniref:Peptide chain release factor n=1 Tax=Perkinsus olseni TaxID=32597 RepID=A0A7J6M8F6_PEROL|nr:Peptide chain release factor [Perkinsus olseni]